MVCCNSWGNERHQRKFEDSDASPQLGIICTEHWNRRTNYRRKQVQLVFYCWLCWFVLSVCLFLFGRCSFFCSLLTKVLKVHTIYLSFSLKTLFWLKNRKYLHNISDVTFVQYILLSQKKNKQTQNKTKQESLNATGVIILITITTIIL